MRTAHSHTLRHRACAWAATLILCWVTAVLVPASSQAAVSWPSGAFAGFGGLPGYTGPGLAEFDGWRRLRSSVATDFLGFGTWKEIDPSIDPTSAVNWTIDRWSEKRSVTPALSVGLFPTRGGNFAEAASGADDAYFAHLATALVNHGLSETIIRLGWEFNGTWYPWAVTNTLQADAFVAAWRQIVSAMRAVPGARFSFDWCITLAPSGVDPASVYPGDAYVDQIGADVYDWNYGHLNPQLNWANTVDETYGLQWQADFAAAHHKPVAFPEWGLVEDLAAPTSSGGDDPTFIQNLHDWFSGHPPAFESYFDSDAYGVVQADYGISGVHSPFPHAAALYQQLWGGTTPGQAAPAVVPVAVSTPPHRHLTPARCASRSAVKRSRRSHSHPARRCRKRPSVRTG